MKTCKDITLRKLDLKGLYFRDGNLLTMRTDGVEVDVDLLKVLQGLFTEEGKKVEFSLTGLMNTETSVDAELNELLNQTV